jgi:hypothetical protein
MLLPRSDLQAIGENAPASPHTNRALRNFPLVVPVYVENLQAPKPMEKVMLDLQEPRCMVCTSKRRTNPLCEFVPILWRADEISNY